VKILELELSVVRGRLEAKSIALELTEDAVDLLVSKGYDPAHGARPLRRTVERFLEDPLAEELLRGVLTQGVVEIGVAADKQSLSFRMKGELPLRTGTKEELTEVAAAPKKIAKKRAASKPKTTGLKK
ncbi:MAG: hypothetical protein PHU80_05160, partial [Kiritimatiellae bacterium]|nr:hypothetical protein [Kiritimatiellia bacterium]